MYGPDDASTYPPPGDPGASVFDEPEEPWYRQPGPLTAAIIGGILFLALLIFLLFQLFSDDDGENETENRLLLLTTDETGAPIDRGFIAQVTGPPEGPNQFEWLQPPDAVAPEPAGASTGADGRLEFAWEAADVVTNPAGWTSEISLIEEIPPNWMPPGPIVECVLERSDEANSVVEVQVDVVGDDPDQPRTAAYSFVEHRFQPGDTVNCTFSSVRPGGTTTTSSSTTSSSTSSTTSTTSSTTTTEPPPTQPPPTEPPPTEPPPTEPPPTEPPTEVVWDVITGTDEISEFADLLEVCGYEPELSDDDATLTIFAPDDDALDIDTSGGCPDASEALIELHIRTEAPPLAFFDITQLVGSTIEMQTGQDVAIEGPPVTVGGARIVTPDLDGANGVVQVVDAVLMPA